MMVATFPTTDDSDNSDDEDVEETINVVPIQVDPILQILEQNAAASMKESDDDDDSDSGVRQQCKVELKKYQKSKSKSP